MMSFRAGIVPEVKGINLSDKCQADIYITIGSRHSKTVLPVNTPKYPEDL